MISRFSGLASTALQIFIHQSKWCKYCCSLYTSQGKTCPYNVVDLSHCQSHQSYYTALSRSATAQGTAIVQGFDVSKITGGLSGWLWKEFRELEILNDITLIRFNNMLPQTVLGHTRNGLINNFWEWKGQNYNPDLIHSSLKWSSTDPLEHRNLEIEWRLVDRSKKSSDAATITQNHWTAHGSQPISYKTILWNGIVLTGVVHMIHYSHFCLEYGLRIQDTGTRSSGATHCICKKWWKVFKTLEYIKRVLKMFEIVSENSFTHPILTLFHWVTTLPVSMILYVLYW